MSLRNITTYLLIAALSISSMVFASPRQHAARRPVTTQTRPNRPQTLAERMCAAADRPENSEAYAETRWEEVYSPRDRWLVDAMRGHYRFPEPTTNRQRVRQLHDITGRVNREIAAVSACTINGGPEATTAIIRGQQVSAGDAVGDAFGYGGLGGAGTGWGGGGLGEMRAPSTNRCTIMVLRFRASFPLRSWCGIHGDHPDEQQIVPGSRIVLIQTRVATASTVPSPEENMYGTSGLVSPFGAMTESGTNDPAAPAPAPQNPAPTRRASGRHQR